MSGASTSHVRITLLRESVLIAQDRTFVERRARAGDGWTLAEFSRPDDVVGLPSVRCALRVGDLYERVEFAPAGAGRAPRLVREAPAPADAPA